MTRRFRPGRAVVASPTRPGDPGGLDTLELGLVYDAFVRSPVAMAMVATDGSLVRCNEAWLAFAGAGEEAALIGTSLAGTIQPRDRGALDSALEGLVAGDTPSWRRELRFVRADGRTACGRVTLTAIRDDSGRVVVVFAQVDDVTERRSADRLRGVWQSVSDVLSLSADLDHTLPATLRLLCRGLEFDAGAVWLLDGDGTALTCAAAWSDGHALPLGDVGPARLHERHFSVAAQGVLVAQAARGLDWTTPLREAAAPGEPWRTGACVALRAGDRLLGTIELYRVSAEPGPASIETWLTGIGARVAVAILRRKSDGELERLRAELARSNSELERYAAVVSHDLSQPLRVVSGYAALLAHRHGWKLDEEGRGYVERLVAGADAMQRLVDDLLDYARIGNADLARGPVPLGKVATAVITDLQPQIDSAAASVEIGPLPDVLGDARQLARVFENLIANALKFRGRQRPVVVVDARPEAGVWHLRVADNGIGIAAGDRERACEMFQRLGTRGAGPPGSGIGLAICRKIVERHGGRLWLGASTWGGTVVHFTLPRN